MLELDFEDEVNTIIHTINTDPTAAKQKYTSPAMLAKYVYSSHVSVLDLEDAKSRIKDCLKSTKFHSAVAFEKSMNELMRGHNKRSYSDKNERVIEELGQVPRDSAEFVALFMAKKEITVLYNKTFEQRGKIINPAIILTDMMTCNERLGLKYKDTLIMRNFDTWKMENRDKRVDYYKNHLSPVDPTNVREEFKIACEGYFRNPEFAEAAVLNYIWLVKREIFGLPIKYHHFLWIQSKNQGTGKTTFVERLKTPLLELSSTCSLPQLVDEKNIAYTEYYILDFDDVSYISKHQIGDLKGVITKNEVSRRTYFSQEVENYSRKFHGIATSNKSVGEIIQDGEMRRFVEVETKLLSQIKQSDWDRIDNLNYLELWRSVDQNGTDPLLAKDSNGVNFYEHLTKSQRNLTTIPHTEEWFNQYTFDKQDGWENGIKHPFIDCSKLYDLFSYWELRSYPDKREPRTSQPAFKRRLVQLLEGDENWEVKNDGKIFIYKGSKR